MEQTTPSPKRRYTAEEYLAFEMGSPVKHELHDGEIVDMSGGTFAHSKIAMNLGTALNNRISDKCSVLGSDMRVRIGESVNYYYPDVPVVCGDPIFDPPDKQYTLVNPTLVVEVASPSSDAFDRRRKFKNYMKIASLAEYVVIDQSQPTIDSFYRQPDGVWAIAQACEGLESAVTLRSLDNIRIPLTEIYKGIQFPLTPQEPSETVTD